MRSFMAEHATKMAAAIDPSAAGFAPDEMFPLHLPAVVPMRLPGHRPFSSVAFPVIQVRLIIPSALAMPWL